MSTPVPIEDDDDVRSALDWFHAVAGPGLELRIRAAQAHFRQATSNPSDRVDWAGLPPWLLPTDPIAAILGQAHALIEDRRLYDYRVGGSVIPFVKAVGLLLPALKAVNGVEARVRRMLAATNDHPIGGLFELAVAGRYAAEGLGPVSFIPETSSPTPDLSVALPGVTVYIECKCLRPSAFDREEEDAAATLFSRMTAQVHDLRLSVHMDASFKVPVTDVPAGYLAGHLDGYIAGHGGTDAILEWDDAYATGFVRPAHLASIQADSAREGALMLGTKMVRLLTGEQPPEHGYCFSLGCTPHDEDNRYVDAIRYGSVLTWRSESGAAAQANALHFTHTLAKVDRQLKAFGPGIAHIAVDVPRSTAAAELKMARNNAAIDAFAWTARMAELHVHYLQDRASEYTSWMIDESTIYRRTVPESLLDDPRIFGGDDIGTEPGWRIPVAPPDT